ncbi:membrane protein [Hazenella sp. IB182357]|uniref:Membrane protein n=1 Tax=Polycladospora coralii TaxID=2771432 RepID=A0A926N8N0_9BACL|nr:membrane protein [Polycladospora coralii]MBD1371827.1 membrane protein [Polycladospora coralii]
MSQIKMRLFTYFTGLNLKSFGISLIIRSQLGTDPWDALFVGLAHNVGFTVGTWLVFISVLILFLNAYLTQKKLNFVSFFSVFLLGLLTDLWLSVLRFDLHQIEYQMIFYWIGLFFLAVGVATYIQGEFAMTPLDELMYGLADRFNLSLMMSKTLTEIVALVLAFLVQGPIGIGTVIFAFCFGPLIQFLIPKINAITRDVVD